MHCGYLSRHGEFIDCSTIEGPFRHESFCSSAGQSEEYFLNFLGWVKLTTTLPNDYVFDSPRGLSSAQIRWLEENGYEVDEMDIGGE